MGQRKGKGKEEQKLTKQRAKEEGRKGIRKE